MFSFGYNSIPAVSAKEVIVFLKETVADIRWILVVKSIFISLYVFVTLLKIVRPGFYLI